MHKTLTVKSTERVQLIDLSRDISGFLKESGLRKGLINIYVPHATCGIVINENYDPNICKDFIGALNKLVPEGVWLHDRVDNNAAAHIKAAIIGPSETIPVLDGKLTLGTWQSPMLSEFDGPRERTVLLQAFNQGD